MVSTILVQIQLETTFEQKSFQEICLMLWKKDCTILWFYLGTVYSGKESHLNPSKSLVNEM